MAVANVGKAKKVEIRGSCEMYNKLLRDLTSSLRDFSHFNLKKERRKEKDRKNINII